MLKRDFLALKNVISLRLAKVITFFFIKNMGAQRLSGRVLDSRPRGRGFEPHRHHCVVSLSKTHLSLLSTGSTQEDRQDITETWLTGT